VIRALVASPLGLLVGLSIGLLGSGGSILAIPALVHAAGQSPQEATTTSLLLVGIASTTGLPVHWRAGRVRWRTGLWFGVFGLAGSFAGTALGRRLDPHVLMLVFSGLILVAAWRMLTACPSCTRTGEAAALEGAAGSDARGASLGAATRRLAVVAAGIGIGFLTGLFGVGGGFVIVPTLTLLLGFAMPEAIGTSLLVVVLNAAAALLARMGTVSIDWTVTVSFTAMAVAGTLAGAALASRIDAERSLRTFAASLVLLALFTAGTAIAALV
jgi:uncharacterized membrane protein YfcA